MTAPRSASRPLSPARLTLLLIGLAASTLLLAVTPSAADAARGDIRVMTRNLYLGADLTPLIVAPTPEAFREQATETLEQVRRTNFPARARLIAREISRTNPHLVGLQEVALWRRGPSDGGDGSAQQATNVIYNFLRLLNQRLKDRGERYRILEVQREADLEGPTSRGFDVRLTMRDVILVKRGPGLEVTGNRGRNFRQNLVVPTTFGPVESTRGWTAAEVTLRGGPELRFVNTHLEAFSAAVRAQQAEELTRRAGALRTRLPTIVLGDLNSDPNGTPDDAAAYEIVRGDGFGDAWLETHPRSAGLTCCFSAEVDDPRVDFSSRIDHVLIRGGLRAKGARRVGVDRDNRTASGLWPSDHAGVVTTLRPRR